MKERVAKWPSEADMLGHLVAELRAAGWRTWPEACGHDLVVQVTPAAMADLRKHADATSERHGWKYRLASILEEGDTIAIEGKLTFNVKVLAQALPKHRRREGWGPLPRAADFYAVAVPAVSYEEKPLAHALDIAVIPVTIRNVWTGRGQPEQPRPILAAWGIHEAYRVVGYPRLELPDLDVDAPAGCASPRALTRWKIAAVRLCLLGLERELVDADFAGLAVNRRTFVDREWVVRVDATKPARWQLTDSETRPDRVYPEIADAIRRKAAEVEAIAPEPTDEQRKLWPQGDAP